MKRAWVVAWFVLAGALPATAQEKSFNLFTAPPEGSTIRRDIGYIPDAGPRQTLDLFLPPKADKPTPLVIYVHGGAWQGGSKKDFVPTGLLARGYAVASVNYRLTDLGIFPAQIQDCKEAVRWLRSHAQENNLDPERFAAFGLSAGGHLVALLATTGDDTFPPLRPETKAVSTSLKCVCDWFGPTDFLHWGESKEPSGGAKGPIVKLFGGPVREKLELAKSASPVLFVSKSTPPMLIQHGDKDPLVPLQQSEVLYAALKKAGVNVTLQVVKNGGHGAPNFIVPETLTAMTEFFDKHLK